MRYFFCILGLIIFKNSFSQYENSRSFGDVLGCHFLYWKASDYRPHPIIHDNFFNEIKFDEIDRNTLRNNPLYQKSYLYSEPEYTYVKVIRYIPINKNPHLDNGFDSLIWEKKNELWTTKDVTSKEIVLSDTFKVEVHFPDFPNKLYNINVDSIINDATLEKEQEYINKSFPGLIEFVHNRYAIKKADGKYHIRENSLPDHFEVVDLQKIIFNRLLKNSVSYDDQYFATYKFLSGSEMNLFYDSLKKQIKGYRIREEYFLDKKNGKLSSQIIALGLVGDNKELGKELLWLYYPVLSYYMADKCTIYKNTIMNYEYILDNHIFMSEIEEITPMGIFSEVPNENDSEFMVELDALLTVELRKEEQIEMNHTLKGKVEYNSNGLVRNCNIQYRNSLPNGPIIEKYNNGTIYFKGNMENGNCEGLFEYYYPSGILKAKRNFVQGALVGEQYNYFPNGDLYCFYNFENGEISKLKRMNIDGTVMEEGAFEKGVMIGKWNYHIICPKFVYDIYVRNSSQERLDLYNGHGALEYSVLYKHNYDPDCDYKLKKFCLWFEVVKQE